ncbi:MAG TPA: DinB family protein [Candidatus Acidoferrales bacterium]|nr:DinB family protein [Candidatus Acidoferrales bacterium]
MNRFAASLFALSFAGSCALQAQTNPLIAENKAAYTNVKNNLLKAAEKMPEDAYSFKPTPEVQSWGQRIAHIANQIGTCSGMTGERKTSDAGNKTAKADLVAALKASFDACDAAWDSMNDKSAMEMIAGRGGAQRSKLGALIGNTTHDVEMYGYLSVYMRLKGVVPPSSDH